MSTGPPESATYRRALELVAAGRHEQALACLREYLLARPKDAHALNDAGAILYALGQHEQAARHLRIALDQLGGYPPQPVWNLAEVYLADAKTAELLALLDELRAAGALQTELANHVATRLIQGGDLAGGIEALLRSFQVSPRQDELMGLYQRARSARPKVAFFCDFGDPRFAEEILEFLRARFDTRLLADDDPGRIAPLLDWCDVAWFEWCGSQVLAASHMPKSCRMICRLHGQEVFLPWPAKVNWANIDLLVTSGNANVLRCLRRQVPGLQRHTRTITIPCGVNVEAFEPVPPKRGKQLACLSRLDYLENFPLVLQCFCKLHSIDEEFRLFLAGPAQQNGMLREYMDAMVGELDLTGAVVFDGSPASRGDWFQDKHYIVSCSVHEGHPVHVLEGMACGLKPVVHAWPGCRDFFPQPYLFRTVDEFCQRILEPSWQPQAYRDFVAQRYPLARQLDRVNDLFIRIEKDLADTRTASRDAANARDGEQSGKKQQKSPPHSLYPC